MHFEVDRLLTGVCRGRYFQTGDLRETVEPIDVAWIIFPARSFGVLILPSVHSLLNLENTM